MKRTLSLLVGLALVLVLATAAVAANREEDPVDPAAAEVLTQLGVAAAPGSDVAEEIAAVLNEGGVDPTVLVTELKAQLAAGSDLEDALDTVKDKLVADDHDEKVQENDNDQGKVEEDDKDVHVESADRGGREHGGAGDKDGD